MNSPVTSLVARPGLRMGTLPQIWVIVLILAAAIVERTLIDTTPDVSWLITLGEKVLAGERPYVDFIEVNPPASIFLYLPAVVFARATGMTPEFAVGLFIFIGAGVSLWISGRILAGSGIFSKANLWRLMAVFVAALTVLPGGTFAQREHAALIAFLPILAVFAARAERKPVAVHWAIVAGIGAGVTAIIKPHFVVPILFGAITAAICARSWRPILAVENWIAAILLALYTAAVAVAYPEFVSDVVPVVMTLYVTNKASLADYLTIGAIPFWAGAFLVTIALKRGEALVPPFVLLLATSCGFMISAFLQRKGLPYHSYPMLALMLAAALIAILDRLSAPIKTERVLLVCCITAFACVTWVTFSWYSAAADMRPLIKPIEASVLKPKVLNISGSGLVGVGFPLTRQLGGEWVGRTCGQWITAAATLRKLEDDDPKISPILDRYMERDRDALVDDIAHKKPDIILVDRVREDWLKWAEADPKLARELRNYRELTSAKGILVLRRNPG